MPQSVQCGLSAALSFCHTPDFGEKQTGLSQTFLVMSGPRAMQPGLQLWTSSGLDTAAHVRGHKEAARLLPTLSLGVSSAHGPLSKTQISDKTKMVHQTTG